MYYSEDSRPNRSRSGCCGPYNRESGNSPLACDVAEERTHVLERLKEVHIFLESQTGVRGGRDRLLDKLCGSRGRCRIGKIGDSRLCDHAASSAEPAEYAVDVLSKRAGFQ